jgi:predicted PurR-regulated permease PerM
VPSALTLGLIAALLTFIPNIGPALSAVPAAAFVLARMLYVGDMPGDRDAPDE